MSAFSLTVHGITVSPRLCAERIRRSVMSAKLGERTCARSSSLTASASEPSSNGLLPIAMPAVHGVPLKIVDFCASATRRRPGRRSRASTSVRQSKDWIRLRSVSL